MVGPAVAYNTFGFTVTTSGTYTFLSTGAFDNFTFLYEDSFDPNSPLTHAVIGSDDLLGLTTSGFAANLTAGTHYVFVTTGFGNSDFGAFGDTMADPAPWSGTRTPRLNRKAIYCWALALRRWEWSGATDVFSFLGSDTYCRALAMNTRCEARGHTGRNCPGQFARAEYRPESRGPAVPILRRPIAVRPAGGAAASGPTPYGGGMIATR